MRHQEETWRKRL